jgi:hypothetical protein
MYDSVNKEVKYKIKLNYIQTDMLSQLRIDMHGYIPAPVTSLYHHIVNPAYTYIPA